MFVREPAQVLPREPVRLPSSGMVSAVPAESLNSEGFVTPQLSEETPWPAMDDAKSDVAPSLQQRGREESELSNTSSVPSRCSTFWGIDTVTQPSPRGRTMASLTPNEPAKPSGEELRRTAADRFPTASSFLPRSRDDPGDAIKALKTWAAPFLQDRTGLREAGAALDEETRRAMFSFLARMFERHYYSRVSKELLEMFLEYEEWTDGENVVDETLVSKVIGKSWSRPSLDVERSDGGSLSAVNSSERLASLQSLPAGPSSGSLVPGSPLLESPHEHEGACQTASFEQMMPEQPPAASVLEGGQQQQQQEGEQQQQEGEQQEPATVQEKAEQHEEEKEENVNNDGISPTFPIPILTGRTPEGQPEEEAEPTQDDSAEATTSTWKPPEEVKEIVKQPPQALKGFPKLEAFLENSRIDVSDTVKELRSWLQKASEWDMIAVGEWLSDDERKSIVTFLERTCRTRPLYKRWTKDMLRKLATVKEWSRGYVFDDAAVREALLMTGTTPSASRCSTRQNSPEREPRYLDDDDTDLVRSPLPSRFSSGDDFSAGSPRRQRGGSRDGSDHQAETPTLPLGSMRSTCLSTEDSFRAPALTASPIREEDLTDAEYLDGTQAAYAGGAPPTGGALCSKAMAPAVSSDIRGAPEAGKTRIVAVCGLSILFIYGCSRIRWR